MTATSPGKVISQNALREFSAALLQAGGFRADHARQSAELLVWANLRGADSHGVLRIPRYNEMIELGIVDGYAEPEIRREAGAVAVVEGGRVPGASGMSIASDKAVELAGRFGIGLCSIVRTSHAGAIGYFAERVARVGMVGIAMSASRPLMVYYGAKGEGVSTNPLAIAVPIAGFAEPMVLDMSTAAVALGKVMAARDAGKSIPLDWGVDENGVATADPAKVKAVLPMAGPKGSGLSLMIEILTSVLADNPLISTALTDGRDAGFNGLVIALNPKAFGTNGVFEGEVARLAAAIRALPPAEGTDRIQLPGERSAETMAKRLITGIPIASGTVDRLIAEAAKRGVQVPAELA